MRQQREKELRMSFPVPAHHDGRRRSSATLERIRRWWPHYRSGWRRGRHLRCRNFHSSRQHHTRRSRLRREHQLRSTRRRRRVVVVDDSRGKQRRGCGWGGTMGRRRGDRYWGQNLTTRDATRWLWLKRILVDILYKKIV